MPLIITDRVLESSTTTGTGVFTLAGASLGFRSFASVCSVADTVWYYIEGVNSFGQPTGEYEYGLGTYSGANQLTRTTVRGSSNGGAAVNFTAGTKLVGIAPMAPDTSAIQAEWRAALVAAKSGANTDITSLGSGDIGIGTTTPLFKLVISNAGANGLEIDPGASTTTLQSYNRSGAAYTEMRYDSLQYSWRTSGTERMSMRSDGNLGLGIAATANQRLYIKGGGATLTSNSLLVLNSASSQLAQFRDDGAINFGGSGGAASNPYLLTTAVAANVVIQSDGFLYRSTSSVKYKKDVADYANGIDAVMRLRPVTYKSKAKGDVDRRAEKIKDKKPGDSDPADRTYGGLIAEEVHAAGLTEFVQYDEDGSPDALYYGHMVALAFKAIQEQQAQIVALQAEVSQLKK